MQLPLPQCGWCAPYGLYLHLAACASEQTGQFGSCTLSTTAVFQAHQGRSASTTKQGMTWSLKLLDKKILIV